MHGAAISLSVADTPDGLAGGLAVALDEPPDAEAAGVWVGGRTPDSGVEHADTMSRTALSNVRIDLLVKAWAHSWFIKQD